MAKPHFTPRRQECPLCNAIMMMVWNLKVDVNCHSCGRKFFAPKHNVQLNRTDPTALNDVDDASILHQLDEFQMNCTNAWCSFTILIKTKDSDREEKFEKFRNHKTQCKKMFDLGKRFQEIDENGEEIYVEIAKFGLTKEVEFAMMQEKALQEKEQDATTDKEVSDSSRNSDDSERFSDSDDDMTTN